MEGDPGDDVVTADDVAALNRASVERSAALARLTGAGVIIVGAIVALSWLWIFLRTQGLVDDVRRFGDPEAPAGKERLDAVAFNISVLGLAAVLVGIGAGLRALADYFQARVGSSITGFQVGDRFSDDPDPDDVELEPEPTADS